MKQFKLISSVNKVEGCINITTGTATNYDVATALYKQAEADGVLTNSVINYANKLLEQPEVLFIESEDGSPVNLAFGWRYYYKEAAIFAAVLIFALLAESIFNLW